MINRLSQKLETRVKVTALEVHPLAADPQRDWSASAFSVSRTQYILCCNTASLYSWLFPARGIIKPELLLAAALHALHHQLEVDGMKGAYLARELGGPSSIERFAKPLNRSVIGSMNDLILHACRGSTKGGRLWRWQAA